MDVPAVVPRCSPRSWASDLRHPLPLGAVALLSINDHLLKGAGLLPGWVTGKLSDVAGLFFFPVLLAALARGATVALRDRDVEDRRLLAAAAALATGAGFAAVKTCAPLNAWVAGWWGVMVMDGTDLLALPVLALAAAWMTRPSSGSADRAAPRRFVDLAAVLAAGLASAATSKAPEPKVAPAPVVAVAPAEGEQGVVATAPGVAVAGASAECASLVVSVCERSPRGTFIVVETAGAGPGACELDVLEAFELTLSGDVAADKLPGHLRVEDHRASTFSLSFLRPVEPDELGAPVRLGVGVRRALHDDDERIERIEIAGACSVRAP